jgi:hypothetical protein
MGRKGANKRKPKASSWPVSKANQSGSGSDLVKEKDAPLNKAGMQPLAESKKVRKKGN